MRRGALCKPFVNYHSEIGCIFSSASDMQLLLMVLAVCYGDSVKRVV